VILWHCGGLRVLIELGIGMVESEEFALELFDTLSRRRRTKMDTICKDELKEIWSQITDQSFDSRLQIFFEMY
jgi:respiratory burst oxidase